MDELDRFARQLATRLAARPGGADGPVSVAEIRATVLPYGSQRRALGLSSVEDYETMLLRLIAEERGYVQTIPAEAAERCREELSRVSPDLALLEQLGNSMLALNGVPAEPERARAPARAPRAAASEPAETCRHCRGTLPAGRTATFCPWCGERLIPLRCRSCEAEIEAGWRHCIACGAPLEAQRQP